MKVFRWSNIAKIIGNLEEDVDQNLIGRKKDLSWLVHCLGKKDIRLITIHGKGGTGKTKLLQNVSALIETARNKNLTTQSFPEVIFIDLSRALNTSNILQSLMTQIPESRRQEIQKSILDNQELLPYQKATSFFAEIENRNLVVVLDKFENAVNLSDQSLYEEDLFEIIKLCLEQKALSSLKLILVSRFPVGIIQQIRPERQELYQLRGLSSPDAVRLIFSLDYSGSARLKNESKGLLKEICYQLEGNPSAIERLVGYLRRFPSVSASNFLDGNRKSDFNTLIENLIDFEALEKDFQRVIQTLSVFQIPCSIDLICYVLSPFIQENNVKNSLSKLVNLYLVSEQDGLYQIDIITRNNSLSALEWGNCEDAYCSPPKFTRFCLLHRVASCINQYREYNSFNDSLLGVELAIIEFDRWLEGEDFDSSAEVLLNCVNSCLYKLGYYDLAIELHEKLIKHPIKTSLKSSIFNNLGCLYLALEKIENALKWFEESEHIPDNFLSRTHAIGNKGLCYDRMGNPRKAIQQYSYAISEIKKFRESEEYSLHLDECRRLIALWISNIGICHEHLGNYQKAIKYHDESIRISKASKVVESQVQGLGNLGDVYGALGEFSLAGENYQDALDIIHDYTGSQYSKGVILASWAEVLTDQGCYERSISMASEAVLLGKEINSPSLESLANSAISRTYLHRKQANLAFEFIQNACKADFYLNKSYSFLLRGIIELKCGQPARKSLRLALRYASELLEINSSWYEILAYQGLALCGLTLYDGKSRFPTALRAFNNAFKGKTVRGFENRVLKILDEIIDEDKDYLLSDLRADLVKMIS